MKEALRPYADKLAALGHEARLQIMGLLLSARPQGLVVAEIQERVGLPSSTLSHHLDTLRREGFVAQAREGKFVRYTASDLSLEEVAAFLRGACAPSPVFVERRRRDPWGA